MTTTENNERQNSTELSQEAELENNFQILYIYATISNDNSSYMQSATQINLAQCKPQILQSGRNSVQRNHQIEKSGRNSDFTFL